MESIVRAGLRSLLRYRVPESEVESTLQRILDAATTDVPDAETGLGLAQRVQVKMDAIAPRPREPIPRGSSKPSPGILREILIRCTASEREVLEQRYQKERTIEEIAPKLRVSEDEVRDVLRRVRQRILFLIKTA
jgi:hypothetical protein